MVACAAVSVQQLSCRDWMQPQSAGCCASVDQLKQQLLEAVENDNLDEANDVIVKLEKCGMTKEILEVRDALAARPAYRSECRARRKRRIASVVAGTDDAACVRYHDNSPARNTSRQRGENHRGDESAICPNGLCKDADSTYKVGPDMPIVHMSWTPKY
ncbi:unnamed protein product [Toxocara canis]|uniref:CUE domain-containing protein n=1 Tax=Toxocara canis TaxID=6265 RepID=A0A183VBS0_TOXCA|nr:unnamed protein product [Toxocara canis]